MNNKSIITTTIAAMVLMGIITTTTLEKSVSAMTPLERFLIGKNDALVPGGSIATQSTYIGTPAFHTHSFAYQHGYIAAVDIKYNLVLPYYSLEANQLVFVPGYLAHVTQLSSFH